MHKSFLYQNIFCDTEKISCDFSVGMELENRKNQKTESINKNENNENKNVHKFQELMHILHKHKIKNTKVKTQNDIKTQNAIKIFILYWPSKFG